MAFSPALITVAPNQQYGAGFKDFIGKANNFLRKSKIISRVGNVLGAVGVPYAGTVGSVAGAAGYGRKKRRGSGKRKSHRRGRGAIVV